MDDTRRALRLYCFALPALFAVAIAAVLLNGFLIHNSYPHNTFLFDPAHRFTDFTIYTQRFRSMHQGGPFFFTGRWVFSYFPATVFVFWPFFALGQWEANASLFALLLFFFLGIAVCVIAVLRHLVRIRASRLIITAWVLTVLLSYPVLFNADRGNIEGVVLLVLALGVFLFFRQRYTLSAIILGAAAATKLVPLILILLFAHRRRFGSASLMLGTFAALNLAGLLFIGPTLLQAGQGWMAEMARLKTIQVLSYSHREVGFEHSGFALIKQVLHLLSTPAQLPARLEHAYPFYVIGVGALFVALYLGRIRHLPILNQLFALIACQLLLPPFSGDYTLLHMYIPFTAFLVAFLHEQLTRANPQQFDSRLILLPCAILFTPQSYLLIYSTSMGGQVKSLALVAILFAVLRTPLPTMLDEEAWSSRETAEASLVGSHLMIR